MPNMSNDRVDQILGVSTPRALSTAEVDRILNLNTIIIEDEGTDMPTNAYRAPYKTSAAANPFGNIPGLAFGPITDGTVRSSLRGGLAVLQKSGQFAVYNATTNQMEQVFDFEAIQLGNLPPAFVLPKRQIVAGDLIIIEGKYAYVLEVPEAADQGIRVFYPSTNSQGRYNPPLTALGFKLFSVVKAIGANLLSGLGGEGAAGGRDPMLTMMLMGGLNGQGGNFDASQMLPLLLLGREGAAGGRDPMLTMMLMGGLNGQGGQNGQNPMQALLLARALGGAREGGEAGGLDETTLMALMAAGGAGGDNNTLAMLALTGGL